MAAAAAGERPGELPEARLPGGEEERTRVEAWLAGEELGERPLVVLYPGASRGAGWKRWPADRYNLLGRRLAAAGLADVVVAWGPGEEDLARVVAGGDDDIRIAPATTLRELAELLRRADLFVGPDTGPAHIAGVAGTRVLGIYGPSDAARNRPLGEDHVLLTEGEPIRPRPWTRALMAERMAAIPASRVYDEAARMLEAP
jgi:heptosyltransferase-1